MTTYLLHGGATSKDHKSNDLFFDNFTSLVDKKTVKILLCYWARETDEWKRKAEKDKTRILAKTNKKIIFSIIKNTNDLFSKIDSFDVLYVAGGEAELLEPYYKKLKDLKYKLKDKIYAGSSMGAFLVSEQYVLSEGKDSKTIHDGIGLLPIQILCHWNVERNKKFKLNLLLKSSKKPILTLDEFEFIKIYNS